MPVFVLLPFYVRNTLGAGAQWYGFLLAAVSVGAILGFVVAGILKLQGPARSGLVIATSLLARPPSSSASSTPPSRPWPAPPPSG